MNRLLVMLLALTCSLPALAAKKLYTYAVVGNAANVTRTTTNLGAWAGLDGTAYSVSARTGVLSSTQAKGSPY